VGSAGIGDAVSTVSLLGLDTLLGLPSLPPKLMMLLWALLLLIGVVACLSRITSIALVVATTAASYSNSCIPCHQLQRQ
jgi:hypothetical protein